MKQSVARIAYYSNIYIYIADVSNLLMSSYRMIRKSVYDMCYPAFNEEHWSVETKRISFNIYINKNTKTV